MKTLAKPESHCRSRANQVLPTGEGDGHVAESEPGRGPVRRYMYVALGVAFVALGAIGAILPGIPTAGPLLLASWFFARSFPPLEQILIRNRFFRRFHHYLDHGAEMPFRARVISIAAMWLSIGVSIVLLLSTGKDALWLILAIVTAGIFGTWFIARFRGKVAGRLDVNSGAKDS